MAFRFFRRRQKMVIIIMVLLMVSFLIGLQGFRMLFDRSPGDKPIARTRAGEISFRQRQQTELDLDYLRRIGLGRNQDLPGSGAFQAMEYLNGDRVLEAYTVLVHEARRSAPIVRDSDVDRFFEQGGRPIGSPQYEALMSNFREESVPSKEVRAAVARWLGVRETFLSAQVEVPPSELETQRFYRDLMEKISLRCVRLAVPDLLAQMPDPTDRQIVEQFNEFRTALPARQGLSRDDLGFGYQQFPRVRIGYLHLRQEPVERAIRVTRSEVMKYWANHEKEFVKEVPVYGPAIRATTQPTSEPATQSAGGAETAPTTAPTTAPATAPAETRPIVDYKTVPMSPTEAMGEARWRLTAHLASETLVRMAQEAQRLSREYQPDPSPKKPPLYEWVRSQMLSREDAKTLLDRKITIETGDLKLIGAIRLLSEKAKVGICFPWGDQGEYKLDDPEAVTITGLSGADMTLGEALDKVVSQVKGWPKLEWATCAGAPGAIFPVAGVQMSPLKVQETSLFDEDAFMEDDVLRWAYTNPRAGLALRTIAFSAQGLVDDRLAQIAKGEQGSRMYLRGWEPGLLLWTLLDARPSEVLPQVNSSAQLSAGILKLVVQDVKVKLAFRRAMRDAGDMKTSAETIGLLAVARSGGEKTFVTDLFSRKSARLYPAVDVRWSQVPDIKLTSAAIQQRFMEAAFLLAPKDVEPPYPTEPYSVAVVTLPNVQEVLVIQREDYHPVIRSEYEEGGRALAGELLTVMRSQSAVLRWFFWQNIIRRTDYEEIKP